MENFQKIDESKSFHNRIKDLFIKAGFDILKSDYHSPGADIIVATENVKILIQCKCAQKDNKLFSTIESLIDEYSRKVEKENADKAILVFSGYSIPKKYMSEEEKYKRAMIDHVIIWTDDILEYFEEVISALGCWAKYSILGDLEITKSFGDPISSPLLKISQGEFEFLVFKISPEDLLKISYIFRRDYSEKAYQRMLNLKRLKKEISRFLDSDEALLPTNLIGVFDSDIKIKDNKILIPRNYKTFWIIDGQHRLFGFCYTKDDYKRENFEILCVGLDGKKWKSSEQAKLFVDINEKSKKISRLLLFDLYELIGIKDMRVEVVKKLSRESKVFENKIKINRKQTRPISLVTFATTSPMNGLVNEKHGDLGFFFKDNYGYFPNDSDTIIHEKCRSFYFKVINDYFNIIESIFPEEWKDHNQYILSTDRGVRVFLRLFRLIITYNRRHDKKFNDAESIREIISALKGFNFKNSDLKGKYLGEGGAENFLVNLKHYIQKSVSDFFPKEKKEILAEVIIESSDREKIEKLLERWIPNLGDHVYGELSYIDPTTFDYFKLLSKGCKINLLVSTIKDLDSCIKKYRELKDLGYHIEIRKITKRSINGEEGVYLHERWISGNNFELDLGVDMKKSALGGKKHTFRVFGNVINSERLEEFKDRWKGISNFKEREIVIENLFN